MLAGKAICGVAHWSSLNACFGAAIVKHWFMVSDDFTRMAFELGPEDRLELARRLVESVIVPASDHEAVVEGIRRIDDIAAGRVIGLTKEEYRSALQ